jgi:hypothetical protein
VGLDFKSGFGVVGVRVLGLGLRVWGSKAILGFKGLGFVPCIITV